MRKSIFVEYHINIARDQMFLRPKTRKRPYHAEGLAKFLKIAQPYVHYLVK